MAQPSFCISLKTLWYLLLFKSVPSAFLNILLVLHKIVKISTEADVYSILFKLTISMA